MQKSTFFILVTHVFDEHPCILSTNKRQLIKMKILRKVKWLAAGLGMQYGHNSLKSPQTYQVSTASMYLLGHSKQ